MKPSIKPFSKCDISELFSSSFVIQLKQKIILDLYKYSNIYSSGLVVGLEKQWMTFSHAMCCPYTCLKPVNKTKNSQLWPLSC